MDWIAGNSLYKSSPFTIHRKWSYKRGGLWWEWPFKRGGLIRGILLYEVENGFSDIFVHYIKGYFVSKYLYFKI
jgi:hypothetical protein